MATNSGNGNQQSMDYVELGGWVTNPETQAWDGVDSAVEPGEYTFEVIEAVKEQAKTGTPQVTILFEVVSDGPMKGRRMRGWYALTEAAIGRLLNVLKAAGIGLDGRNGFSTEALKGARIIAEVFENVYEAGKNPMTQQPIIKTSMKIRAERPLPTAREVQAAKAQPKGPVTPARR